MEKVFVRQLNNGLWQWRRLRGDHHWKEDGDDIDSSEEAGGGAASGDTLALSDYLKANPSPVCLILPGELVPSCTLPVDDATRRHMAKLLPYELEEKLIDPVDQLHFSFHLADANTASVRYVSTDYIADLFETIKGCGCEVMVCLPDYLLLPVEAEGITILQDDGHVLVNLGRGLGITADMGMASVVLKSLPINEDMAGRVRIFAKNQELAVAVRSALPEALLSDTGPEISLEESYGFWDDCDVHIGQSMFNLRQGQFARQLPLKKWSFEWRYPAIAAGIAFVLAVAMNMFQLYDAKADGKALLAERHKVFRSVVPGKKSVRNPEAILRQKLGGNTKTARLEPTNMMPLVFSTATAVKDVSGITIKSFRYSGDSRELRIDIQATDYEAVEKLRSALSKGDYDAELMRTAANGEGGQEARIKLKEKAS